MKFKMKVRYDYKKSGKVVLYINGRKIPRVFKNDTEAERFIQKLRFRRYYKTKDSNKRRSWRYS